MRMSSGRRMDEGRECQPLRLAGDWWRRPQVRVEAAPVLRPYPGGKREPAGARCCRTLNRRCKKMHGLRGEGGWRRDALRVYHGDQPAIPTARFIVVKDEAIERGQRAVTANCSERMSERKIPIFIILFSSHPSFFQRFPRA